MSESNHKLYEKYYQLLNNFLVREEISLSSDLKRERSEQLRDDECFEKIEKKIKIDWMMENILNKYITLYILNHR